MITTDFANEILDHHLRGTLFVSLHNAAPAANNQVGKRVACGEALGKAVGGIKVIERSVVFDDLPKGDVSHVGLWSAAEGGRLLLHGELAEKRRVEDGGCVRFRPGKLAFSLE